MSKSAAAERIPGPASLTRRRVAHLWRHPPSRHGSAAALPPRASICTATVSVSGWSARVRAPLALYWRRLDVERVLAGREPVRRRVPPCYMDMAGAVSMLGVVRSYVYRLVKKGLLREYRCRMKTARGLRVRCFYHREDLEHVRLHVLQKR